MSCNPSPDPPRPKGSEKKGGISPTKYSRLNEKQDLANLNNRLACYIDRVRSLETENRVLSAEAASLQEKLTREVSDVRTLYEGELSETRRLLDELSRENAKLQIDSRRLFTDIQEFKCDFEKKQEEVNKLESSLRVTESGLADMTKLSNILQTDNRKLVEENKILLEEKNRLSEQLNETRKQLDKEMLRRVDVENSLQTAREEFTFNEQLLEKQLFETKRKIELEVTAVDGKLNEEYAERYYHDLQDLREQYELDLQNNKEEIKRLYEEKIKGLNHQLTRASNASANAMNEVKNMQVKVDELHKVINSLELDRNAIQKKVAGLEKRLELARSEYMEEYKSHQVEVDKLRECMAQQMQEYQDLMDIKIALDLEIAAYRKLLECEEARLNITPVDSPSRSRKILRGKRRHCASFEELDSNCSFSSSTKCDIAISEVSPEGKFIKLENKSNKDISIGHWQLRQKTVEDDIIYKFNKRLQIPAGGSLKVWSECSEDIQTEDSKTLMMKGKKWIVSDKMRVTLINHCDEEVASADNTSIRMSSKPAGQSFYRSKIHSDLNTSVNNEERCVIM